MGAFEALTISSHRLRRWYLTVDPVPVITLSKALEILLIALLTISGAALALAIMNMADAASALASMVFFIMYLLKLKLMGQARILVFT